MVADRTTESSGPSRAQAVQPRCSGCGRMVAADARECPFCGRGLLVDLVLEAKVGGSRAVRLAGELANLARRDRDEVARRLRSGRGVVVDGLSREEALACQELLESEEAAVRIVPSPLTRGARHAQTGAGGVGDRSQPPRGWRRGVARGARWLGVGLLACLAFWCTVRPAGRPPDRRARFGSGRGAADPRRVTVEPQGSTEATARVASGFQVAKRTVVTTARVTGEVGSRVRVGGHVAGRVVACDEWLDVAVVEVADPVGDPLVLGDSSGLSVGDRVQIPGTVAASAGVVEGQVRSMGLAWLELDAEVSELDSGGPVLGSDGKVVGMLQRRAAGAGFRAMVLPVEYLVAGPEPLLAATGTAPSAAWTALLTGLGLGAERRPEDLATDLELPILVRARRLQGRPIEVEVALLSTGVPRGCELSFALLDGSDQLWSGQGQVPQWQPVSPTRAEVELPPAARWLDRHRHTVYLYLASTQLSWSGADPDVLDAATLVVRNGLPGADRCRVNLPSQRSRTSAEKRRSRG